MPIACGGVRLCHADESLLRGGVCGVSQTRGCAWRGVWASPPRGINLAAARPAARPALSRPALLLTPPHVSPALPHQRRERRAAAAGRGGAMSAEWGEKLVRRRSCHDQFGRLPSAFDGLSREELDELKREYFLDDDEVETYVKAFRKYDQDKSGDIDSEEIALLLKDLGLNFPPADVYDMIQAVDLDGSGTIGVPEFITLIADPEGPLGVALEGTHHKRSPTCVQGRTLFLVAPTACLFFEKH